MAKEVYQPPADAVAPLWAEYHRTRSVDARNALVLKYQRYSELVVRRALKGIPSHVEPDDYISVGIMGLMHAIEKFDPARGLAFVTFAHRRIRGEVLDELRRVDYVGRGSRSKWKKWTAVTEALTAELGRPPTPDEIFIRLGISAQKFKKMEKAVMQTHEPILLSEVICEDHHSLEMLDLLHAPDWSDPYTTVEKRDMVNYILRVTPARYRMLISHYYILGWPMEKIGEILGISRSCVSSTTATARRKIRKNVRVAA